MTENERAALAELRERLGEPLTLEDCGRRLNLSREAVRRIESKALAKLARAAKRAGLSRMLDLTPEDECRGPFRYP